MTPLLLLLACPAPDTSDETGGVTEEETGWVDTPRFSTQPAPRMLRRMSLDLLGVLPSAADLDRVEADPTSLSAVRDELLEDPRLEDRLVQLLADRFLTRTDDLPLSHRDYGLDEELAHDFNVAVGEEPLRLLAHVAANDLPWTDIVTADYAVANGLLRDIWPLESEEDTDDWTVSTWTDGRPAVGVLASNGLWWRYDTGDFNFNRRRGTALSALFLCVDYLERRVATVSSPDLADADGIEDAAHNDPGCVACHASLDPLGSSFFGFWWFDVYDTQELTYYHPEREPYAEYMLGIAPNWWGHPIDGLAELGRKVAGDNRFLACTAETAASMLWRRSTTWEDFDRLEHLRQVFVESGLRYKALLAAVTDTDEYQADGPLEGDDLLGAVTIRLITPSQLKTALEDLVGFTWVIEGYEQLGNDAVGYRQMAGGVDGLEVTSPQLGPSVSQTLVARRYAEAAASHAVAQELVDDTSDALLPGVTLDSQPGDTAFDDAVAGLAWRLFGERLAETERTELGELWTTIDTLEGPEAAWTALLSVLFRDPRMLST